MAYFSANWLALAADNYAEAMTTRLSLRLNDGVDGAPSTLLDVTDDGYITLDCNPLTMAREYSYGVIQAQAWIVRVSNADLGLLDYDLHDCWCCIEGGFIAADEWEILAQGRVTAVEWTANADVILSVISPSVDLLRWTLPRDIYFQADGWAGNIQTVSKADGSSDYENDFDGDGIDEGVTVHTEANCRDETFYVEFTASNTYKVIKEDDTEETGLSIAFSNNITSSISSAVCVTIISTGWDGGTFASGDRYVFYTAEGRSATELTPVGMIRHLISTVSDLAAYDVQTGAEYGSIEYDSSAWQDAEDSTTNTTVDVEGFWQRGTLISALIQDAMVLVHASIFPVWTGQLGFWMLTTGDTVAVDLNGDPGYTQVEILAASRRRDMTDVVNKVEVNYLTLDGVEASVTSIEDDTILQRESKKIINTGWRVDDAVAESLATQYLIRFAEPRIVYDLETTLAGAAAEVGQGATVTDATIGAVGERIDAHQVAIDVMGNSAQITGYPDPVAADVYARVGISDWDGAEVIL